MTYDQLLIFDAVVRFGSFKAASEILHKIQPSLSMAIKKLEHEIAEIKRLGKKYKQPETDISGNRQRSIMKRTTKTYSNILVDERNRAKINRQIFIDTYGIDIYNQKNSLNVAKSKYKRQITYYDQIGDNDKKEEYETYLADCENKLKKLAKKMKKIDKDVTYEELDNVND